MMKRATHSSRISDKWKAYSGMAAAFLIVAKDSDAQVVYTDVDPDAAVVNGNYDIDFDNDGNVDVQLVHFATNITTTSGAFSLAQAAVSGEVIGTGSSSSYYPSALAAGALIAPSNPNFVSGGGLAVRFVSVSSSSTYGNWVGQTAYLGCRFTSGMGQVHYGWVHLTVDPLVSQILVRGYAFESTPVTAITAGDIGLGTAVAENKGASRLQVFPNPVKDQTTVKIGEELSGQVSVQLLDGIGRVLQQSEMNTVTGTRQLTLDMSSLPAGSYFISVRNGDKVLHRNVSKVN